MRKTILAALGISILVLSSIASADGVDGAVSDLDGALAARLASIGPNPGTKQEKKEGKRLGRAGQKLSRYQGDDVPMDLKTTAKVGKLIAKSGTTDAGVLAAAADLGQAVRDLVGESQGVVVGLLSAVSDPPLAAKLDRLLTKADSVLDRADASFDTDPARAMKFLVKAWLRYAKAIHLGEKFVDRSALRLPYSVDFGSVTGARPDGWSGSSDVYVDTGSGLPALTIFSGTAGPSTYTETPALRLEGDFQIELEEVTRSFMMSVVLRGAPGQTDLDLQVHCLLNSSGFMVVTLGGAEDSFGQAEVTGAVRMRLQLVNGRAQIFVNGNEGPSVPVPGEGVYRQVRITFESGPARITSFRIDPI